MPWDFDMEPELIERQEISGKTEMLRLNTGKPRFSLLPTAFVLLMDELEDTKFSEEVAKVMDFGATKYAMNNWRKSGPWLKVLDSGLRHLYKIKYSDETNDPESGISHAGHLGCNLAFLLEFVRESDGEDDRYKTKMLVAVDEDMDLLDQVFYHLTNWKDGADHEALELATQALATWFVLPDDIEQMELDL